MRIPSLPVLTDRLSLRGFTAADLDALHALHSRPEVSRFLMWEPWTRTETAERLTKRLGATVLSAEGQTLALAVELRSTGEVIGEVILTWTSADHRRAETGFVFHPDHHGRGYGREAATEMLRLGFETFGFHRIVGSCDSRNAASSGLMRRLGMRQEASLVDSLHVKGEWCTEEIYAMLASEWRDRPAGR